MHAHSLRWFTCVVPVFVAALTAAAAAQPPAALVRLSPVDDAGYNSIVVGRDGTVHAVWQGMAEKEPRWTLFYSASRDGRRWSAPLDLTGDERMVSTVRVVADGAGRVYAIWKAQTQGNSLGPQINPSTLAGSDWGSLRFRVLEEGRWSGAQDLSRPNGAFGWFAAADPSGTPHVYWSESADATLGGMVMLSSATIIRQARLSGTQAQVGTVVQDPGIGFHGLHGAMAADGRTRFVAIGSGKLLLWDGARLVSLGEWKSSSQLPPRLLLDASGRARVLVAADETLLAIAPDGARTAVFRGRIEHFNVAQDGRGNAVVLIGAKRDRTTDLLLVRPAGAGWTEARAITRNADATTTAGFMDASGTTINSVSEWNAQFASADVDAGGGVSLLLTNSRVATTSDVRAGVLGRSGVAAAFSSSHIFFTRVGGGTLPGGTPPVSTVTDTPARSAPLRPAERAAGPAPAPVEGLPAGTYGCSEMSEYAGPLPANRSVTILDGRRYRVSDLGSGEYSYAGGRLRWISGPFSSGMAVTFTRDGGRPTLRISERGARDLTCHAQ